MTAKIVGVDFDMDGNKVTGLADPSSSTDAVTLSYVENFVRGRRYKDAVRVASTTNLTLSSPGASIDGVALDSGDRVLVKNQTNAEENGIYVWNGAAAAMTRAADFDASAEVASGTTVHVYDDTASTNDNTEWVLTTDGPITLGTTELSFTSVGGGTTYSAGDGLQLSSTTFSVVPKTNGGLGVDSGGVYIPSTVAGAGLTYTNGVVAVGAGDGITVAADAVSLATGAAGNGLTYTSGVLAVGAGTGISVAADAVAVDTAVVARWASATAGNGSSTGLALTHSFGNRNVLAQAIDASTFEEIEVQIVRTSTSVVTFNFQTAPATNSVILIAIG